MYDKDFDSDYDDYGGGGYGGDYYGDEPAGSPGLNMPDFSGVKAPKVNIDMAKLKPFIIVAVIILIIGAAVLFFIGSQNVVEFNIKESGGSSINARFEIETPDGKRVFRQSNTASEQVTLGAGDYDLIVTKSGYEPYNRSITIPADIENGTYEIELYRVLDAGIQVSVNDIDSIYGTKNIPGTITITNNSNDTFQGEIRAKSSDIDVLFPGDKENLYSVTLPGNGPTTVTFELGMSKTSTSPETSVKVDFYVVGTKVKDTLKLKANPVPEITMSESELKDTKITAGKKETEEIDIKNKSKFSARNITFEITADGGYEANLDWFEFAPYDGEPYKASIATLTKKGDPGEEETLILYVEPPATAEIGDEFRGRLVMDSVTFEEPISIQVNYIVDDVIETKLELKTGSNPTFRELTNYETFTVKNKGDLDVDNVTLKVENYGECGLEWIDFLDDTGEGYVDLGTLKSSDLSVGDEVEINVILLSGTPGKPTANCKLLLEYIDPITKAPASSFQWYIITYDPPE